MKKIFLALLALAAVPPVLNLTAAGQSPSCLIHFEFVGGFYEAPGFYPFPLPAGTICGESDGPWTQPCYAPTASCAPIEPCPTCAAARAGHPIDLATGNTDIAQSDISIPGLGGGLRLARTWNSRLPAIQGSFP